jgi:hypothetical protein
MKIVVSLYCLGNNDRKKHFYMPSINETKNIANPLLVKSSDVETASYEGQLLYINHQVA